MWGTNACIIRLRGSSGLSAGESRFPSLDEPPNTEPDNILEGVPALLGETDLEPEGVEVDANRDETDAFLCRYWSVDTEDDSGCVSMEPRSFGSLNEEEPGGSVGSKGEALLEDVMKIND
jgi:hypothetical protein